MVNSNNKLEIFENFQIDNNLSKFKTSENVNLIGSLVIPSQSFDGSNFFEYSTIQTGTATSFGSVPINVVRWNNSVGEPLNKETQEKTTFWKNWFKFKKKSQEEKRKTMTILTFFSSLAQSLNDLKTLQDIAIHYETAITNASKAGQTALVDKLKTRLVSAKSEAQLVALNLNKFLTEDQIVDFYKMTNKDKKLKLTWIKHFVKNIPTKVLEVKENLDKQLVFDNYVILHYDPNNDATDLSTEEKKEIERRQKDPILFGVLKDSRRLYYIADWIDEYCNLTLDVVLETLREKVNEVNNDSVKTYLDRGERIDTREKLPNPDAMSAMTMQFPITFEKVYEDVKKRTKKLLNPLIPKMKRTSSANKMSAHFKENKKKK